MGGGVEEEVKKKFQIEQRGGLRFDKSAPASQAAAVELLRGGSSCLLSN